MEQYECHRKGLPTKFWILGKKTCSYGIIDPNENKLFINKKVPLPSSIEDIKKKLLTLGYKKVLDINK